MDPKPRKKAHIYLRLLRFLYRKVRFAVRNLRGEPSQIAWGGAIGIFVALTPTMGFQTVIAVFLATLFRANRIIAGVLVWVTNVFTAIPIYAVVLAVGRLFLHGRAEYVPVRAVKWTEWRSVWEFFKTHFEALWVGSIVLGTAAGAVTYVILFRFTRYVRRRREEKRAVRAAGGKEKDACRS